MFAQQPTTSFRTRRLPEPAILAGYAALIDAFTLSVPLPHRLAGTLQRHATVETSSWRLLGVRYAPQPTLIGHLTFALKYEGLDLAVLKRLFEATGPQPIEQLVRDAPTGTYARRIWFLYEWLTGSTLELPDATQGRYVDAVDPKLQHAAAPQRSPRHRVRDNLPGTARFCPLVFNTPMLARYLEADLPQRALDLLQAARPEQVRRAASFLVLQDARTSFQIENERPSGDRTQRWAHALREAGEVDLTVAELERLQAIVLGDVRAAVLGVRKQEGFVGDHDRESGRPIPAHISARAVDLSALLAGLLDAEERLAAVDPVIAAAVLAFGFVYIHPFEDGNGRIHRFLIHHVLTRRGVNPRGLLFPISAAILHALDAYQQVLNSYASRLLPCVDWTATRSGNVEIHNDTADFYRFFDATPHAQFLVAALEHAVDALLPAELHYLQSFDTFERELPVELPKSKVNLLVRFLEQNGGVLSQRARTREFRTLTDAEVAEIEALFAACFVDAELPGAQRD